MKSLFAALGAAFLATAAQANPPTDPVWLKPVEPFRIVGNVYYVGSEGLAAYLIVSPQGDVLVDGALPENAPLIERNVAKLGFRMGDVKVLVDGHAHFDHAGGLARLKADSGAELWASAGDRWALEHGRHRGDDNYGGATFPPVKVDRVVRDGETIRLGDIQLTAHLTPGHTPGCTTWSLPVSDRGRALKVLFAGCFSNGGNILVGNRAYPTIVADYRASYRKLKAMQADVVLPEHPDFVDLLGREQKAKAGDLDAFIDPTALEKILAWAEPGFEKELAKQQAAKKRP